MKRPTFKTISSVVLRSLSVLVLLLPIGVGAARSVQAATAQAPAAKTVETGGDYEIGPEDVLDIAVWQEKDLQREVLVRPDGWLTFPLIGSVQAAGKTTGQLQTEITTRLKK